MLFLVYRTLAAHYRPSQNAVAWYLSGFWSSRLEDCVVLTGGLMVEYKKKHFRSVEFFSEEKEDDGSKKLAFNKAQRSAALLLVALHLRISDAWHGILQQPCVANLHVTRDTPFFVLKDNFWIHLFLSLTTVIPDYKANRSLISEKYSCKIWMASDFLVQRYHQNCFSRTLFIQMYIMIVLLIFCILRFSHNRTLLPVSSLESVVGHYQVEVRICLLSMSLRITEK